MKKRLNIRQEKFCQKYLECGVAVEAMLHAYPSRRKCPVRNAARESANGRNIFFIFN